ncbi:MAG: TldD/PmbA family protein [Thermoplasmata archaeon]
MKDIFHRSVEKSTVDYVEFRYHSRDLKRIEVVKGDAEEVRSSTYGGIGVRVFFDGAWGFSSTSKTEEKEICTILESAESAARFSAKNKKEKPLGLGEVIPVSGTYEADVNDSVTEYSIEDKVTLLVELDKEIRSYTDINSAKCLWNEMQDDKIMVNSLGTEVTIHDEKVEFYASAYGDSKGEKVVGMESSGVTGGWKDLFAHKSPVDMARKAVKTAQMLLKAKHPKGGKSKVILNPELVGLISHEAIGHTVEADFVLSGSIAQGKIGEQVASELVTMVDHGIASPHAAGWTPVDDEGTPSQRTEIIKNGILTGYLCDRETGVLLNVPPKGNARAFEYSDPPIIRMTNTFIEPGDHGVSEVIEETKEGFYLEGAMGGQADANAEFMFGVEKAWRIVDGELTELLRGVSISGSGFDVLKSVDAVGDNFEFKMGSGYCGKGQMAKVDGGGPHLRCEVTVGGKQ